MTENRPVHLTPPEEFSYNDKNVSTAGMADLGKRLKHLS